jgi:hypothetical protein
VQRLFLELLVRVFRRKPVTASPQPSRLNLQRTEIEASSVPFKPKEKSGLTLALSGGLDANACVLNAHFHRFAREVCCPSSWASPMRIPSGPRM